MIRTSMAEDRGRRIRLDAIFVTRRKSCEFARQVSRRRRASAALPKGSHGRSEDKRICCSGSGEAHREDDGGGGPVPSNAKWLSLGALPCALQHRRRDEPHGLWADSYGN